MLLITKELAEAVIKVERVESLHGEDQCPYCKGYEVPPLYAIDHEDNCIVVRAKLLLEQEWGIKS